MTSNTLTDRISHGAFRNAIFAICESQKPTRACLDRIGQEAAGLARRSRAWSGAWLYMLLHFDRYSARYNTNDKIKIGIQPDLLNAVMQLAKREAMRDKQAVTVYAHRVREGSIVFGHSRKCARRRCGVWFVSDTHRLYCSDTCKQQIESFRRKQRRIEARLKRRKGNRKRMRR